MFVAPSEPRVIKSLGKVSSIPERYGSDVWFVVSGTTVGVQRKEISDLIASVQDGRLGKECAQLQQVGRAVLIVEGRLRWTSDGLLMKDYGIPWSRSTHRNLLYSVQSQGIWVESTEDANDTVAAVLNLQAYLRQPKHHGLLRRPGPVSPWGKATNKEWLSHFLQGLEGVGPETAENIINHFGGRCPIEWRVTEDHLRDVKGIGPKRAKQMMEALQ